MTDVGKAAIIPGISQAVAFICDRAVPNKLWVRVYYNEWANRLRVEVVRQPHVGQEGQKGEVLVLEQDKPIAKPELIASIEKAISGIAV